VSDKPTVAHLVPIDPAKLDQWREGADLLRDIADRMEAGEIGELVVVYNHIAERCFASFGHFDDRWRLLGALEYAKQSVAAN